MLKSVFGNVCLQSCLLQSHCPLFFGDVGDVQHSKHFLSAGPVLPHIRPEKHASVRSLVHSMHFRVLTSVAQAACEHALHLRSFFLFHMLSEKCISLGRCCSQPVHNLRSCLCRMHNSHRPRVLFAQPAWFHSVFDLNLYSGSSSPHSPRHFRSSLQFTHQSSDRSLPRHFAGSNTLAINARLPS